MEGRGVTIRNRKNVWHNTDSSPGPTASELCCPNPTNVNLFLNEKSWQFWTEKYKKTALLNEKFFLHIAYAAKNKNKS